MNSFNLICNMYKSYSIDASVTARLPAFLKKDDNCEQLLEEAILLCKTNSIEIWRQSDNQKGIIEMCSEVNAFCNILRVFALKSSSPERGDIIVIISSDLQYRLFHLSIAGEVKVLHEGSLIISSHENALSSSL